MRFLPVLLITFVALCSQFAVKANNGKKNRGDSIVQGSITDVYSKKPVSEVTVSVSSSKKKETKTSSDASGAFSFPQMPPGEYTIVLEKKGYKTYRKDYIMAKEGIQLKLSLEAEDADSGIDSWNPLRMLYGK